VLIYNDKHWQAFFALIGRPELRDSPMFGTHTARAANIGAVYAFVAEVMATRGSEEWIASTTILLVDAFLQGEKRSNIKKPLEVAFIVKESEKAQLEHQYIHNKIVL